MASACGWPVRSEAASISSEVVSPLPHSRAMSRKGALVTPAIGARRAGAVISTGPIFMGAPVYRSVRPQAAVLLARLTGQLPEQLGVAHVGRHGHHLRVAQPHELGVDHDLVTVGALHPDVGEEPPVAVAELHVGL